MTEANLLDRFAEALRERGGTAHRVADLDEAHRLVVQLCAGKQVVVDADPIVAAVAGDLERVEDPWQADVGLTTARAAGAATGTLGLAFDRDHPRRTGLVPPAHVAVVPAERVHPEYADVLRVMGAIRPVPSGMRLVSGPSSSGDIEQVHIRGMHGPIELHVVLVGEPAVSQTEGERVRDVPDEPEPVAEPVVQHAPEASPGEHR